MLLSNTSNSVLSFNLIFIMFLFLSLYKKKENVCNHGEIKIGDHVWVASFSHILKNSAIPDGSVVAYHSLVTKKFEGEKLLLGGCPAKVIEEEIEWER